MDDGCTRGGETGMGGTAGTDRSVGTTGSGAQQDDDPSRGAVGGNSRGGNGDDSGPLCQGHKRVCALRTVQKEGANKGRQFYCCANPRADQCKTFIWVDESDQASGRSNLGSTGLSNGGGQEKGDGRVCAGHKEPCAFRTVRKE
ncbi:unnamed protein product, partial [Sphacelaria rigidula]